jgi:hypothetical protein
MRVGAEMRIAIEEIARIALENQDISRHIGNQLGLTEEDLDRVYSVLEGLLNEDNKDKIS